MKKDKIVKSSSEGRIEGENPTEKQERERAEKELCVDVAKDAVALPIKAIGDTGKAVIGEVEDLKGDITDDWHQVEELLQKDEGKNEQSDDDDADSLFDQLSVALFGSVMAYAIADLRKFAVENPDKILGDPELVQKFLELPITDVETLKIASDNLDHFAKEGTSTAELYRSAIQAYAEQMIKKQKAKLQGAGQRPSSIFDVVGGGPRPLILVFDDENSSKELVYSIAANR